MKFTIMTLFPEMVEEGLHTSILGRGIEAGFISVEAVNIRDFTEDRHRRVDDYPYGGGAGMLMQAEPIWKTYEHLYGQAEKKPRTVYLTPWGRVFNQKMAREFAREEEVCFLCGHYEGVDERILDEIVTDPVSIGDYVLTGGELAAMVMIDAISRMVPGVLTNEESGAEESFSGTLLEYPQYTRPEEYLGRRVPDVLLSGHHLHISEWRREQAVLRTARMRPDLLPRADLTEKEIRLLLSGENLTEEEWNQVKKVLQS